MPESGHQGQQPLDDAGPAPTTPTAPAAPAVERLQRFTAANMIRSLLPLVLGCLLIVGVTALRQNPSDPIKEVDPSSAERAVSQLAGYPLLVPSGLPEGWRPTSSRTDAGQASKGDPVTLQIGWYTPGKEFAEYVVTDDKGATELTDVLRDATPQGDEQLGGETWQRLRTQRGETALTRAEGTATLLVSGSASDEELSTLAGSLQPYSAG